MMLSSLLIYVAIGSLTHHTSSIMFPSSFTADHKSSSFVQLTLTSLFQSLSLFEIDSHIEVVLLDDYMDDRSANDLSKSLEVLSSLSSRNTPFKFVHEKLVFHVTLGKTLNNEVTKIVQTSGGVVKPSLIEKLLHDYHSRASTLTTMFVFLDKRFQNYSYGGDWPYCKMRSFLSPHGFAWVDLMANGDDIMPTHYGENILPPPVVRNAQISKLELASTIHRSGEAIVPFPLPSSYKVHAGENSLSTLRGIHDLLFHRTENTVNIVVITICSGLPASAACAPGADVSSAIQSIKSTYTSSFVQILSAELSFLADEEPQLLHALQAASKYAPAHPNVRILSSSELLYWLGSSSIVKDNLSRIISEFGVGRSSLTLVPVFVVRVPVAKQVFFDEYKLTVLSRFEEPPGGWGVSKLEESIENEEASVIASKMRWPSRAVTIISHTPEVGADGDSSSGRAGVGVSTGLECGGIGIPGGERFAAEQMWHGLREAIWGIPPPFVHFSTASNQFVEDYLWYAPSGLTSSSSNMDAKKGEGVGEGEGVEGLSFRERRAVHRHTLMHKAEQLLQRFSNAVSSAHVLQPPVNISDLLDLKSAGGGASGPTADAAAGGKSFQQAFGSNVGPNKPSSSSSSKKGGSGGSGGGAVRGGGVGILESFLFAMDEAASDISHLEFDSAFARLNGAEIKVLLLEDRVRKVVSRRVGFVSCPEGEGVKSGGASSGTVKKGGGGFFVLGWWQYVLMAAAVLAGMMQGYFSSKEKVKN